MVVKLVVLSLAVLALTAACSQQSAFTAAGRQAYRADICGQYLSPESTSPVYSGRGRSCVVKSRSQ
jgi:hypothetical protein